MIAMCLRVVETWEFADGPGIKPGKRREKGGSYGSQGTACWHQDGQHATGDDSTPKMRRSSALLARPGSG